MIGIDMGFWYGIITIAVITAAGCLAAWLMPPKKVKEQASEGQEAAYQAVL